MHRRFVAGALVIALAFGFLAGVGMMAQIARGGSYAVVSGALKQAHGHAQLLGWVGLFIMGVAFHVVPRFSGGSLRSMAAAKACFALTCTGVVVRALAQPFAPDRWIGLLAFASATLELAGIGMFVWLMSDLLRWGKGERGFYEKFLWASLAWLTILAMANFALVAQMAKTGARAIPALAEALWVHGALFGFISNMIFAFSLRIFPHFLGLQLPAVGPANAAFWLWNGAIFLRYPLEPLARAASVLELAAAALLVYSLRFFAPRRVQLRTEGGGRPFSWFIYLGYGWLLAAALLPFHADWYRISASSRHAMAVGFITSVLLGVGLRLLPIFHGAPLHSPRAADPSDATGAVRSCSVLPAAVPLLLFSRLSAPTAAGY